MISVLTPMLDGSVALQEVEREDFYTNRAVENFITGGPKFRKGMRVVRTDHARGLLKAMGMSHLSSQQGTYTGKASGKFRGCILVRIKGSRKAEPFAPELWKPIN
jgi:hypothetical protein